jgi:CheY-like chemotaxis protein
MSGSGFAGRRILVVEDEMLIAMMIEDMLDEIGCQLVGTVSRPAEALAAIEAQAVDAAILDVNLDGVESYGIAAALQARGIPFVFSTGYQVSKVMEGYGDRPVLRKPFRSSDLSQALEALFAASGK